MTDATHAQHADRHLVLLHGWGMNSAVWDGFAGDLPAGVIPCPIDLPGHGDRAFSPRLGDLWSWADACLEAAPERAIWLGWSLGALVALAAAVRAPKRVEGLILMTGTPRFVRAADWTPAMLPETLEQFHAGLLADSAETLARFLALQVRGSDDARETLRGLRRRIAERPQPDSDALSIGLDILRDEDMRGRLPDIRCPTLWIFGTHDALVPPAVAERVEILMPGAATAIIQGAAHAPHLSHPGRTRETVRAYLSRIEGPATLPGEGRATP
ncbi:MULTISPECIES: pimeloyl-ACP methyl ester esterase BioH [unclassified Thiocapsa]|uniref:pimeloyl-ACP methyl ester esterase BioH n=1 Tax=unclassified Thiocapsa TaxID=2641286 RepID=UPI0035B1E531